jgi:chromosome segregation ATPase
MPYLLANAPQPLWDVCCTPPKWEPAAPPPAKRSKLAELDPNIHYSIVGTCLTMAELRRLSHLVGASNRADIRRLVELEEECERLKEHNARHATQVGALELQAGQLKSQLDRQPQSSEHAARELAQLRAALADRDQKLALHTARRNETEQKLLAEQERNDVLQASARQAGEDADTARLELRVLEQALTQSARHGIDCHPIRSASIASFVELMQRLHSQASH